MTVKEAIRHLYTYSSTNGSGQTTQGQHEEAKQMAIKALEAQQWIPGKPKESGMYLVTGKEHFVPDHVDEPSTRDGAVGIAAYSEKWGWLDKKIYPVKAYMPLPKPYVPQRRKRNDHSNLDYSHS